MTLESSKWLRQAEADLKAGRHSLEAGDYEWSCFQAQQSAREDAEQCLRCAESILGGVKSILNR